MAQMLVRVNEKMDKLLKKIEKTTDIQQLQVLSVLVTDEVYKQWKEPKIITHEQKMEMQSGEVEDEWNS